MSLKPSLRAMHHHRIEDLAHELRPRPAARATPMPTPRRRDEDVAHEMRPRPAAIACGNCGSIIRDRSTSSNNNNFKPGASPSPRSGYVNPGPRGGYVNADSRQKSYCAGTVGEGESGRIGMGVDQRSSMAGSVGPDPMLGILMAEINSLRAIIHKLSAAVAAQQSLNEQQHHHIQYPPTNTDINTINNTHMNMNMHLLKRSSHMAGSSKEKKHSKHVQFSEIVTAREVPVHPRRNAMEYEYTTRSA